MIIPFRARGRPVLRWRCASRKSSHAVELRAGDGRGHQRDTEEETEDEGEQKRNQCWTSW